MVTCCLYGNIIISLLVVLLSNELELDVREQKANLLLEKLEIRKAMKNSAAFIVTGLVKLQFLERMTDNDKRALKSRFNYHLKRFKKLKRYAHLHVFNHKIDRG